MVRETDSEGRERMEEKSREGEYGTGLGRRIRWRKKERRVGERRTEISMLHARGRERERESEPEKERKAANSFKSEARSPVAGWLDSPLWLARLLAGLMQTPVFPRTRYSSSSLLARSVRRFTDEPRDGSSLARRNRQGIIATVAAIRMQIALGRISRKI